MKGLYSRLRWQWVILISAITPPCQRITQLCSLRMEGVRPLASRWQLPVHFIICAGCRRYLQQLEFLRKIGSASTTTPTSVEPMGEARKERLRERLRCERPG